MLSLQDNSHPALTELINRDTVAKDEQLRVARIDLLGLILRQLVLPHNFPRELFAVLWPTINRQRLDELRNLFCCQLSIVHWHLRC